jgi:hypothetical protein
MAAPYEIYTYSIATLKKILSEKSGALPSVVEEKFHSIYFENYFHDLGACTILVENDYIDRDYMEDFAGFYARCFGKYESSCTRLHFFGKLFTPRQFQYALVGKGRKLNSKNLQESYLGFVVVKKLPKTFIGRTCLKTYDSDNGRRVYPTLREYPVGLFGLQLSVERTLGFQEQDCGAAACATSALWTVFQGTGKLFQHAIPSQLEITRIATQIPDEAVPGFLPSRGLTGRQEIYTVRQLGLEAAHTNAQDEFNMTGSVYAYLRLGIPILLRIALYDTSDTSYKPFAKPIAGHAVAVTGFSLGGVAPVPYDDLQFNLRATRIDKLYVHDDQVGPFARMGLDGIKVVEKIGGQTCAWYSLATSWKGKDNIIGSVRAVPKFHLIPLYSKIRIRFEFIRDVIMDFDKFLRIIIFGPKPIAELPSPFEWDIFLTTVNDLKSDIRKESLVENSVKRNILLHNMPRFIWRAKAIYDDRVVMEFLFDATDIEQGKFFIRGIEYDRGFYTFLQSAAQAAASNAYFQSRLYWRILDWFATAS